MRTRTFKCNLDLFKSTDNKLRWDEDVDGTKFELYIPKWRVPEPTPPMISVKIYDATGIDTADQLSPKQKIQLSNAGWLEEQVSEIDAWLPVRASMEEHSDRPIIAAVTFDRVHTETVRYSPIGEPDQWEVGQPYVPISVLPPDYPKRLLVRVTWVY